MDWFAFAVSYAVSWWMVLFMVLPFGVNVPETRAAVEYASAPDKPRLRRKIIITSLLALIPAIMLQYGIQSGWFDGVL